MRRTWKYLGKVYRTKEETLSKKMSGAWIPSMRNASGRPQMACKDNFIQQNSSQFSSKKSAMMLPSRNGFPWQQVKNAGTHWSKNTLSNFVSKTSSCWVSMYKPIESFSDTPWHTGHALIFNTKCEQCKQIAISTTKPKPNQLGPYINDLGYTSRKFRSKTSCC